MVDSALKVDVDVEALAPTGDASPADEGVRPPQAVRPFKASREKLSYVHELIVNRMLEVPRITVDQLAVEFKYSPRQIAEIKNSPPFKARIRQLIDERRGTRTLDHLARAALKSARRIDHALDDESLPPQFALNALATVGRLLGMGSKANEGPAMSKKEALENLETLSENMVALLKKKKAEAGHVLDAEVVHETKE